MTPPGLSIRQARLSDIEALTALLEKLFTIEADFIFDHAIQARGLRQFLDGCGKHRTMRVAEMNHRVIGMISVQTLISTAEGGIVGLIEDMIVDPGWQNRAIGQALLTSIENWAALRGITRLQLLADRNNAGALTFYERAGWEPTQLICLRKRIE